jgi:predicted ATPase
MSMARLWRDQGKGDEARELLAPVYGWFTEGFDRLDLKEAKDLLNDLVRDGARSQAWKRGGRGQGIYAASRVG